VVNRFERHAVIVGPRFLEEELRESNDRREWIVQLVGDAGQGSADSRHPVLMVAKFVFALTRHRWGGAGVGRGPNSPGG